MVKRKQKLPDKWSANRAGRTAIGAINSTWRHLSICTALLLLLLLLDCWMCCVCSRQPNDWCHGEAVVPRSLCTRRRPTCDIADHCHQRQRQSASRLRSRNGDLRTLDKWYWNAGDRHTAERVVTALSVRLLSCSCRMLPLNALMNVRVHGFADHPQLTSTEYCWTCCPSRFEYTHTPACWCVALLSVCSSHARIVTTKSRDLVEVITVHGIVFSRLVWNSLSNLVGGVKRIKGL